MHLNPFVQTKRIENIIAMSEIYKCRPSDIMKIGDEYTAFCFDEACAFIKMMLQDGKKPIYKEERKKKVKKNYKSFKDFYNDFK